MRGSIWRRLAQVNFIFALRRRENIGETAMPGDWIFF